jgi:hypothetical protein
MTLGRSGPDRLRLNLVGMGGENKGGSQVDWRQASRSEKRSSPQGKKRNHLYTGAIDVAQRLSHIYHATVPDLPNRDLGRPEGVVGYDTDDIEILGTDAVIHTRVRAKNFSTVKYSVFHWLKILGASARIESDLSSRYDGS